jgi:ribokinase
LVVGDETMAIQGHAVTAVDSTAAGDAFNGAFAVALCEGKSITAAAIWANRAAAISVTRPGAQPSLPRRAEIESFDIGGCDGPAGGESVQPNPT